MSELLRIKPVSSRSKLDTLREFGHRAFVELGDDGKPSSYWVETKEVTNLQVSKQQKERRPAIAGNAALVWAGKSFKSKRPGSIYAKVAEAAKELATIPTRRYDLVEAIEKDGDYAEMQVTNAISRLTIDGYLVVPG